MWSYWRRDCHGHLHSALLCDDAACCQNPLSLGWLVRIVVLRQAMNNTMSIAEHCTRVANPPNYATPSPIGAFCHNERHNDTCTGAFGGLFPGSATLRIAPAKGLADRVRKVRR